MRPTAAPSAHDDGPVQSGHVGYAALATGGVGALVFVVLVVINVLVWSGAMHVAPPPGLYLLMSTVFIALLVVAGIRWLGAEMRQDRARVRASNEAEQRREIDTLRRRVDHLQRAVDDLRQARDDGPTEPIKPRPYRRGDHYPAVYIARSPVPRATELPPPVQQVVDNAVTQILTKLEEHEAHAWYTGYGQRIKDEVGAAASQRAGVVPISRPRSS